MKLRVKINLAILLTFVIIASIYAAVLLPFEKQRQRTVIEQVELNIKTIIAQRQEQLADELFSQRKPAVEITTGELLKVKGMAAIRVYLADGTMFQKSGGDAGPPLTFDQLRQLTAKPQFSRHVILGKPLLRFVKSIEVIGDTIGFIEIDYDLTQVEKEAQTSKIISVALLAAILLTMFGLLNLLLSKLVLQPVYSLSKTIKKIQAGSIGEQVKLQSRDEIGGMASAFNEMSIELAELNKSLEERVAERTEQLFQTNKELEEARAIAESSTELKSEFLANMSHEIRSPMNAIIGLSHLALKTELTPKLRDYLLKIESSSKALLGIINDILDFSKIEAGKLHMEEIPFRLEDVLDNLRAMVAMKAEERGIELIFHTAKGVSNQLIGDPLRLGQVLLNLTTNAIKFTETGHVLIKIETLDDHGVNLEKLRFSVIDTGIGLSTEQIDKLFKSFAQADSSTTRKYGGTGLGLAICKDIVELMGGTIHVESVPERGSTFSFNADFLRDLKGTDAAPDLIYTDRVAGMRVLVVDDNAVAREILADHLDALQLTISQVASGNEAIAELENSSRANKPYHLVLMDWKMDGMDGIEASRIIKENTTIAPLPKIIMITSYGRDEIVKQAREIGLDGYLVKPVEQVVLLKKVGMVLTGEAGAETTGTEKQEKEIAGLSKIRGARALLVEDNEINQQVASELLADAGIKVDIVNNGLQAFEQINVTQDSDYYDIILMDIQMPVMDGHTATRKIRTAGLPLSDVPIIAMTAHAMESERQKCLENGMNDHIAKPIDPELLLKTLVRWIKVKKRQPPPVLSEPDNPENTQSTSLLPEKLLEFDLTAGLARVAGKKKLYHELLLKFAHNHEQTFEKMQQMVQQEKRAMIQNLAHEIKGIGGNLGAVALHKAAAQLELACETEGAIESEFTHFGAKLQAALDSLATIEPDTTPRETSSREIRDLDFTEISNIVEQLTQQITSDYGAALESIESLQLQVRGSDMAPMVDTLREQLQGFDETAAGDTLQGIAARLLNGK